MIERLTGDLLFADDDEGLFSDDDEGGYAYAAPAAAAAIDFDKAGEEITTAVPAAGDETRSSDGDASDAGRLSVKRTRPSERVTRSSSSRT